MIRAGNPKNTFFSEWKKCGGKKAKFGTKKIQHFSDFLHQKSSIKKRRLILKAKKCFGPSGLNVYITYRFKPDGA